MKSRAICFFIYTSFPVTFQYLPGYGISAEQLLFFGCISIRVLALPSPGILTHLFDAVLSFPSQLFFCFGRIAVAHGDVTCTSRFDLIFYFMTACLFKCMNHIQYTVTMSCSRLYTRTSGFSSSFSMLLHEPTARSTTWM